MEVARRTRAAVWSGVGMLMLFTLIVNLLLLVQPLYMLQIYDRVLSSGSIPTLVYLSIIACAAFAVLAVIDSVRNVLAGRIASRIDVAAGNEAFLASMHGQRAAFGDTQPMRDLQAVRSFVGGKAIIAFLDIPFAPIFLALLWFIHPLLFGLTLAGGIVLSILAVLNQQAVTKAYKEGGDQSLSAMLAAQAFVRNAESIRAMGMVGNVTEAWGKLEERSILTQDRTSSINGWFSGVSKALRMALQSAILGVGGYLVLQHQISGGMIFASSLISGKALQPIDQVIAGWKNLIDTHKAWNRLQKSLDAAPLNKGRSTELPAPTGALTLQQIVAMPPYAGGGEPILKQISAEIPAGSCVVVLGPSGAGKSTLMRVVVGAVPVASGAVRIDGADIRNWDSEQLGRRIGYLSQDVELLPGTVAQNIARFDLDARDEDIVSAAKKAQVHEMILGFPKGYETLLGPGAMQLSGGQRQRVGLARAFYGAPRLLVLDEPNAHLDSDGDAALEFALLQAKAEKITVFMVTQRRNIADRADAIMIIRDGRLEDYGPREAVYERQQERVALEMEARRKATAKLRQDAKDNATPGDAIVPANLQRAAG